MAARSVSWLTVSAFLLSASLVYAATDASPAAAPAAPALRVRPSALAGSWYPASSEALQKAVSGMLERADPAWRDGRVTALIVPHAGYEYAGPAAARAFKLLKKGEFKTVVLMGPSHHYPFAGCLIADVDAYETPLGRVLLDNEARGRLLAQPHFRSDATAHVPEHSLEIELPFLQTQLGEFKLVPILVGALQPGDYDEVARSLSRACGMSPDVLYVVSSDFTHYGASYEYVPFKDHIEENLARLDGEGIRLILSKDFDGFERYLVRTGATICGQRPIGILLKLLPADAKGSLLKYYTSGDLARDWSTSVSYVSIAFSGEDLLSPAEQKTLLELARDALDRHVTGREKLHVGLHDLTPALRRNGAAFVTLTVNGQLRGCIGSLAAAEPLCQCVVRRAADAAEDSRFPQPVQPIELPKIEIEISVLSPPVQVASLNDVIIGRHGLIIEKNGRNAVFLPQVAVEHGWNREQLAQNLCLKAELPPDAWKEGATFRVFTAQVFSEKQFRQPSRSRGTGARLDPVLKSAIC